MCEWLTEVYKYHDDWIRIAKYFGQEHAEDIVQEVYIELCKYSSESKCIRDGKPNRVYMFVSIKNKAVRYLSNTTYEGIEKVEYKLTEEPKASYNEKQHELRENIIKTLQGQSPYYFGLYELLTESEEKYSRRKISRETKISLRTICYDAKKIETLIRENHAEEYEQLIKIR